MLCVCIFFRFSIKKIVEVISKVLATSSLFSQLSGMKDARERRRAVGGQQDKLLSQCGS